MSRTLILLFHPDPPHSKANAALAAAARTVPSVEVVDMQALYPGGAFELDREVERLISADRLVLQFPVLWYSTPPLLKAWQDAVLTRMYYIRPDTEGRRLEGTPLMVAATAGNTPQAYSPEGVNRFPLPDLLFPLQAMASRCGLPWADPFLIYGANRLEESELAAAGRRYAERLREWIDAAPAPA
ncbi:Putative NADPH-quinone reductase (modulator of drug activity B) [Roseomonas rosea]|uniref:Putative NADPH-quinone reductase (Modulator of drug activity B) n=1 Tax=Muricoccus roseus TaxID=198092 RepID=A0A1M6B709_9PROT|nr:NAD(P)H-dependent oxidoreductase [Roseomonas rosea]SHI44437.1 Putative NADPH-quinone reductase (modulator of drug activity B) [Roseomonas rosea]